MAQAKICKYECTKVRRSYFAVLVLIIFSLTKDRVAFFQPEQLLRSSCI